MGYHFSTRLGILFNAYKVPLTYQILIFCPQYFQNMDSRTKKRRSFTKTTWLTVLLLHERINFLFILHDSFKFENWKFVLIIVVLQSFYFSARWRSRLAWKFKPCFNALLRMKSAFKVIVWLLLSGVSQFTLENIFVSM